MRAASWFRVALASLVLAAACGPRSPRAIELRQISASYLFTISSEPAPPHARESVQYRIVVRDRESRQPIETGEGRIFSSNRDGAQTWDGLRKAPEPGTYSASLSFVTSGEWAIAIEFRRDSTARLEKVEWMQDVLVERD